jgi:pyruvate dehydrogenase E2 component (dihydrolipoamide acetyltransferase)
MASPGSGHQFVMPKLGLTMTEATIVEWRKQDGDRVEKGEILFVIETEKVTLEIEAPASGVLHILVPEGETVPVLEPVAMLHEAGQSIPAKPSPTDVEKQLSPHVSPNTHHEYPISGAQSRPTPPISPRARALARNLGITLEGIVATGPRGMIVVADVERAAEAEPAVRVSPVANRLATQAGLDLSTITGTGPGGRIMRQDVERVLRLGRQEVPMETAPGRLPLAAEAPTDVQPLSGLRAVIAERLSASWQERPHVTLSTEADATNLVSARQQAIAELDEKVSYDALLVALIARALREHPHVNVRLTEKGVETLGQINVGVAIDTERGLLVPVVRDVAGKSLIEIQRTVAELAERALAGRSLPDDLVGGTFTITNLGMYEVDVFTPIINPPESAILGVGRIVAKPVAEGRQVVVQDRVTLNLSFDHRLIDGGPAARFLQRVKQLIERPFVLAI